jgi:hypothetical protein
MTPAIGRSRRSAAAILTALALILSLPASTLGWHDGNTDSPPMITLIGAYAPGGATPGTLVPLINSGEIFDGLTFQGLPDGLGVVPGSGSVDLYVTHEESHVPFGLTSTTVFADFQDSSVTRVRVDVATKAILEMEVALPASAGFIRFCSAFMAGPEHGFPTYTFLVNEESNDNLPVPAGAPYGSDPSMAPLREAGYSVWLNTATGAFAPITRMGRHNHENSVVIPGGWNELAVLSGDDTFSAPQVNASQLYLFTSKDAPSFMNDKGQLWAFQVTADDGTAVDPYDAFNGANDYLDISMGEVFSGRFIHVPTDIARGVTEAEPQAGLDSWSNTNNVFQFIRVEDVAYDPDNPRVVYFADTGSSVVPDPATGRMTGVGGTTQRGRIFQMVLNERDPRIVDSFSIVVDGATVPLAAGGTGIMARPDNIDVGDLSLMVQEDNPNAKIWRMDLTTGLWTHVATVDRDGDPTTNDTGESSGILDVSRWFGDGWWALDVQAHDSHVILDPTTSDPATWYTWTTPPIPPGGAQYRKHLEAGQLLLMLIPGS